MRKRSDEEIEKLIKSAIDAVEMEGHTFSAKEIENIKKFFKDEISHEEFLQIAREIAEDNAEKDNEHESFTNEE